MVMQILMLVVKVMGYDFCLMIGFDIEKLVELINLFEDYVIGFMVVIGKKVKDFWFKLG